MFFISKQHTQRVLLAMFEVKLETTEIDRVGVDTFEDEYFITQAICKKGIFSH